MNKSFFVAGRSDLQHNVLVFGKRRVIGNVTQVISNVGARKVIYIYIDSVNIPAEIETFRWYFLQFKTLYIRSWAVIEDEISILSHGRLILSECRWNIITSALYFSKNVTYFTKLFEYLADALTFCIYFVVKIGGGGGVFLQNYPYSTKYYNLLLTR